MTIGCWGCVCKLFVGAGAGALDGADLLGAGALLLLAILDYVWRMF